MTDQLIEKLATKLGTTTEYLWSLLIQKALYVGITNIILYMLNTISLICLYYFWKHMIKKVNEDNCDEGLYIFPGIAAFCLIITTIVCIVSFQDTIIALFNPEIWALSEILRKIGK